MVRESNVLFPNVIFLFQEPVDAVFKELKGFVTFDSLQGVYSLASSYFHFHIWQLF